MSGDQSDPILRLDDVRAGYGSAEDIIKGVSLAVEETEIVTIIGPNGAGKSTLLKAIGGSLAPRDGNVYYRGMDITGQATHELLDAGLLYQAQGRNIFPEMTVRENLLMGGYTLDDGEIEAAVDRVCRHFPALTERIDVDARMLSGGEQQMLEMGMGLMVDPDVLLLDEPSAGLAPVVQSDIFDKIEELNRNGASFLMIEQNARQALSISDRGYVLALGTIELEDDAAALLENPRIRELYLGGEAESRP
ncbi:MULTISPECIES: ABC transporter ATP-binding protein [Salinibaculum]|uniref:ABC transporter ATP-binding protein n=1 Tax=Salinibaculum TaxID=2732368 RepID=UPI0030CD7142